MELPKTYVNNPAASNLSQMSFLNPSCENIDSCWATEAMKNYGR